MLRTFVNSYKVSFVQSANQFIFFLKRIPILGKKISDKLYKQTQSKLVLGIIREAFRIIGGFFRKALYLGVMIILPSYLIFGEISNASSVFLHIFLFLNFILGPLMKTTILNKRDVQAYNMVTLMRAEAREYYLSEIIFRNLLDFVHFLLPTIIAGLIIGFSPLKALIIIIELIAFRFMGEAIQLFIYDKRKSILAENNIFMFAIIIIALPLAYGLPVVGQTIDFQQFFFNIFSLTIILSIGTLAFLYLYKYKKYTVIAKALLTKDNLFKLGTALKDIKFADVKIDEKKMSVEDLNSKKFEDKKGYEYLNSLFFLRHRRIMVTPIKRRVMIIAAVFILAVGALIIIPHDNEIVFKKIQESTSTLVFLMYMMSTGERICKAMFFNCDVSLLRYSYYREGRVILSNFTSRLKRAVLLNLIPALALCSALAIIIIAIGSAAKLVSIIPLFLCILCLACFFSIHHLFMYYAIQPYTAELTVKSPLFKFMNAVVYLISYGCLQIKTSSYYFTLGVLGTTVIYMTVALIITYKVAPRTFRLK